MPDTPFSFGPGDERRLAGQLFSRGWELLEMQHRNAGDDEQMIHTAHASRYHWGATGEPVHWARGEWQCSRASGSAIITDGGDREILDGDLASLA